MDTNDVDEGSGTGRVLVGSLIVLAGVAMLAERAGLAEIRLSSRLWPFIVIALGLARLVDPPRRRRRHSQGSGNWLLWVGAWGLASEFHVLGLDYRTSWPFLVIGAGIAIVRGAMARPDGARDPRPLERM